VFVVRTTDEQCRIDHSHDVRTASTSTSVLCDLLLVLSRRLFTCT
jgi:hypothetical protein